MNQKTLLSKPVTDPVFGKARLGIYVKKNLIKVGETYAWFPIEGNSMTDNNTPHSIPHGSVVLVREIRPEDYNFRLPLHKPLIVAGYNMNGKLFNLLKTICFQDMITKRILMRSYNPAFKDFWIPLERIKRAFEVELVRLPNGKEFIPKVSTSFRFSTAAS